MEKERHSTRQVRMVKQPENINVKLFNHQLASIYNMEKLERTKRVKAFSNNDITIRETHFGINADEVGSGKCLAKGTPVMLYSGMIKKVEDIVEGERLMGDDSTPRTVLSVCQGREKMYKIKQHYGEDYTVNASHILSLKMDKKVVISEGTNYYEIYYYDQQIRRPKRKQFIYRSLIEKNKEYENALSFLEILDPFLDINVEEYLKLSTRIKSMYKGYKVQVNFPRKKIDQDPYIAAITLGNILLTTKEAQTSLLKSSILNSFSKQGIPPQYLYNTLGIRSRFLLGLVNSPLFTVHNTHFYVCQISISKMKFINDLLFLSRSLGLWVYSYVKNQISKTIIDIQPKTLLTHIEVSHLPEDDYYGFTLDGNHRFLLGDTTVTHNTLSMIGLIARDRMKWDLDIPLEVEKIEPEVDGIVVTRSLNLYQKLPATLIITSTSIIYQWGEELSKTNLRVSTIISNNDLKRLVPQKCDVVLISTNMYNRLCSRYKKFAWKRFIFDEPGHVRIPSMKEIHAGFYWFVTATPAAITSKHINCRASFIRRFIPDYLPLTQCYQNMIIQNQSEFIHECIPHHPIIDHHYQCYLPIYRAVQNFVTPVIRSMIEGGNIEGAIISLGGDRTDNIVELIKKRKLECLEEIQAKIRIYTSRENFELVEQWTQKEKRIIQQIQDIEERFREILGGDCHICFSNLDLPVLEPSCQNVFCGQCLFKWLEEKQVCPLCRSKVDVSKLVYINTDPNPTPTSELVYEKINRPKTKLETVVMIIKNKPEGKFLLFSSYPNTFTSICKMLEENKISYTEIKGNANNKKKHIEYFKYGSTQVIFVNSNTNVAGMNLQEATDIILYHKMDETTEQQIIGRVNRIGRQHDLHLHYLHVQE